LMIVLIRWYLAKKGWYVFSLYQRDRRTSGRFRPLL